MSNMNSNLNIELPTILDCNHPIAFLIDLFDENDEMIMYCKELNTETLEAKLFVVEDSSRIILATDGTIDKQFKKVTIKFKNKKKK